MTLLQDYDDVGYFREGIARVYLNEKCGCINKTGKEVIPPVYDNYIRFIVDLAEVEINGKHGFINKTGKKLFP